MSLNRHITQYWLTQINQKQIVQDVEFLLVKWQTIKCNVNAPVHVMQRCLDDSCSACIRLT